MEQEFKSIETGQKSILPKEKGLSTLQVTVMAVAAGASVANIYYNQPILKDIATTFHVNEGKAGSISMLSQIGYGVGLFFLIPLGDKTDKKKLILLLLMLLCVALGLITFSQNITQVWILSVAIGILSVSVHVIVPMAASLDKENRGKTIGHIFTGILIGILAARVCSGFIARWLGWRYVYGFSTLLILSVTLLLQVTLPHVKTEFKGRYLELLQSTLLQIRRFPLLREAAVTGGLLFGVFCSFWTTLTFHLSGYPFYYRADKIGMFGLVAIAGALLAPYFGKIADKGGAKKSLVLAVSLIIISLILIKLLPYSTVSFVIAVLILDIGVQAMQVTNVARIYTLDENSYSRINTIYMTSYFIGGALGTFAGLTCWRIGGWSMATWQMLAWSFIAMIIILKSKK